MHASAELEYYQLAPLKLTLATTEKEARDEDLMADSSDYDDYDAQAPLRSRDSSLQSQVLLH